MTGNVVSTGTETPKWAAYLDWYIEREGYIGERSVFIDAQMKAISRWRDTEWEQIQFLLQRDYEYVVPPEREPYWVAPGTATLFQEKFKVDHEAVQSEGGVISLGWQPAGPFPLNNVSQFVYYIEKGLRLRPLTKGGEEDVELLKVALPSESPQSKPEKDIAFQCLRHWKASYGFRLWDGYIKHCDRFNETLEFPVPSEVVERAKAFPFFCIMHNMGFANRDLAEIHVKNERRRSATKPHLPAARLSTTELTQKKKKTKKN